MGFTQAAMLLMFLCLSSLCLRLALATAYNIMQYGAKGDGKTDDTQAFVRAWGDLCNDAGDETTLTIPMDKTFLVGPIIFQGPCNSSNVLHFQLRGTIVAPSDPSTWKGCVTDSWLYFKDVNGLVMNGGGTIDGRGKLWWNDSPAFGFTQEKNQGGCNRPTALHFDNCNGLQLSNLTHRDSPRNHIGVTQCSNATISNLYIVAPADSPNTDGIDISSSTHVHVQDSVIQTGDDCLAINSGSSKINITGIDCGPGHGISIGSLGANGVYDTVEEIHVQNCNLTGTQNGARIKTWQGGSGYAKAITFEHIQLINVDNPILIDQYYCDGAHNCKSKKPSAVKVSDVTYKFIQGTSACTAAINFNCSNYVGCTNLVLEHIDITAADSGKSTTASCINAEGTSSFTTPNASCLSQ